MTDRRWHEMWKVQCDAAQVIKLRHGVESAFDYVVGEKLLKFAEAASDHPEFARALPPFRLQGQAHVHPGGDRV